MKCPLLLLLAGLNGLRYGGSLDSQIWCKGAEFGLLHMDSLLFNISTHSSVFINLIVIVFLFSCRGVQNVSTKPGSTVSGVVERLTPGSVIVHVKADGYVKGTVYTEHLSDYQGEFYLHKLFLYSTR